MNKSNVTKKHELPRFYSAGLFRSDSEIFQEIKRNKNSNQDTSLCKYNVIEFGLELQKVLISDV